MGFGIGDFVSVGSALLGGRKASKGYGDAGQQIQFDPYDITTGIGRSYFGRPAEGDTGFTGIGINRKPKPQAPRTAGTELAGPYADIVGGILPQIGGMLTGTSPQLGQLSESALSQSPDLFNAGYRALGAGAGTLGQAQGLFNQGRTALGTLGAMSPSQAASERFSALEELMNPARQRDREALESRLLRQGRLGSTGGGLDQEALETAVEQSRRANALAAFDEARTQQQHQLGLGSGLFGIGGGLGQLGLGISGLGRGLLSSGMDMGRFGAQLGEIPFARGQSLLGITTGLENQLLDQLRLGGSFGQAQMQASQARAPYLAESADITGRMIAGLGQGFGGALTPPAQAGSLNQSVFGGGNTYSSQPYFGGFGTPYRGLTFNQ